MLLIYDFFLERIDQVFDPELVIRFRFTILLSDYLAGGPIDFQVYALLRQGIGLPLFF